MEEIIKEKPIKHDDYWYEQALQRINEFHNFYKLRYSFNSFSYVSKLEKVVKQHRNLLFSFKNSNGLFLVEITNQNG